MQKYSFFSRRSLSNETDPLKEKLLHASPSLSPLSCLLAKLSPNVSLSVGMCYLACCLLICSFASVSLNVFYVFKEQVIVRTR